MTHKWGLNSFGNEERQLRSITQRLCTYKDQVINILASFALIFARRKRYRLPPGPGGLPVIGHAHKIPKSHEWVQYREWSRECGSDIISLNVLGQRVIVLNSARAVNDLLEKRSKIYSDREYRKVFHELVGWKQAFSFIPCNDDWKEQRKLFHEYFNSNATKRYREIQASESKKLLLAFNEDSDDIMGKIRLAVGSTILRIVFGREVRSAQDPFVENAEKAMFSLAKYGNTGSVLADYIPILHYFPAWMPGGGFKREAAYWRSCVDKMYREPYEDVEAAMANGTAVQCVLSTILTKKEELKQPYPRDATIRGAVGTAFLGGSDTTVSSLGTFVLAMMLFPEVQLRARQELDQVIGQDRLPGFEDLDALPYITAIVKEVIRWRPVIPLATPHFLKVDDEYRGYDIPAGSVIIGNSWAILFDEERYPNPNTFDPTRYLTSDGKLDRNAPDPCEVAFGFGRRMCPGRHLAIENIWINVACILATMKIEKPRDELGNIIEPSGEYTTGLLSHPVPFKADIRPRTESAATVLRALTLAE